VRWKNPVRKCCSRGRRVSCFSSSCCCGIGCIAAAGASATDDRRRAERRTPDAVDLAGLGAVVPVFLRQGHDCVVDAGGDGQEAAEGLLRPLPPQLNASFMVDRPSAKYPRTDLRPKLRTSLKEKKNNEHSESVSDDHRCGRSEKGSLLGRCVLSQIPR
jgi:hypothetical protein